MDTDKLRCFCLVYETRSFTKAADQSFFTRQAVSKAIKSMEEGWGCALFLRNPRGLEPTQEAEDIYPLAKRIVSLYGDVLDIAERPSRSQKPLAVAVANGVVSSLPKGAFGEFRRTHPDAEISISVVKAAECEAMVIDGQREVAITIGPVETPKLRHVSLKTETLYFIGLESVLDEGGSIPSGTRLLLLDRQFKLDRILLEKMGDLIEPLVVDEGFDDYDRIVEMVKAGAGVCVGPESYLRMFEGADVFVEPIDRRRLRWEISLVASADGEISSAAHSFADFMIEQSRSFESPSSV